MARAKPVPAKSVKRVVEYRILIVVGKYARTEEHLPKNTKEAYLMYDKLLRERNNAISIQLQLAWWSSLEKKGRKGWAGLPNNIISLKSHAWKQ